LSANTLICGGESLQENRNYLDIAVPENGDRKGEKKKSGVELEK